MTRHPCISAGGWLNRQRHKQWGTTLQRNVPSHALSRISSFDWLGSIALNPIGYALIGPLSSVIGVPPTLVGSAALNISICIGVVLLPSVRAIGSHPVTAEPVREPPRGG